MKAQGQSKSGALSTAAATRSRGATSASRATDAPRVVAQRKQFQSMFGGAIQRQGPEDEELLQGKAAPAVAPAAARGGLPAQVQSGVEALSGVSLDGVKVHYNSAKPAEINALAHTQGSEIHVGPGQEQHLAHEAWHVVQQAQGRVRATRQMEGNVAVNDDVALEHEADVQGAKALEAAARPGRDKN